MMSSLKFAVTAGTAALVFAAGMGAEHWLRSRTTPPASAREEIWGCYFDDSPQRQEPLVHVNGSDVLTSDLPADLASELARIETDRFVRLWTLADTVAARLTRQDSGAETKIPESPDLTLRWTALATDTEVDAYLKAHKSEFGGLAPGKARDVARRFLEEARLQDAIRSRVRPLRESGQVRNLRPLPCGAKVRIPYSGRIPGRGNGSANINLAYFTDFTNPGSRSLEDDMARILSEDIGRLRVWVIPVPAGRSNPASEVLARVAICTRAQNEDAFWKFRTNAYGLGISPDSPDVAPQQRTSEEDALEEALRLTTALGISADVIKNCLKSPETDSLLDHYHDVAARARVFETPSLLLNERALFIPPTYKLGDLIKEMLRARGN